MIRPNQTTELFAGDSVGFTCVAYGVPNPSISWNRGNILLTNGSRATIYEELLIENGVTFVQSILQLCNAEVAEAGQYSCFASNTVGSDTASFELAVTEIPARKQLYNLHIYGVWVCWLYGRATLVYPDNQTDYITPAAL